MIEDRWEAIRYAIGSAQTDDCVVIVGRGHKDYVDWVLEGDHLARVSCLFGSLSNPFSVVITSIVPGAWRRPCSMIGCWRTAPG